MPIDPPIADGRLVFSAIRRLDHEQRRSGVDLHVGRDQDAAHAARDWREDWHLGLHRLEHRDAVARRDEVARRHHDHEHHRRRGCPHHAALVARDAMRDAVDLDAIRVGLGDGDDAVPPASHGEPALEGPDALDADVDRATLDEDPICPRTEAAHLHRMGDAICPQPRAVADLGSYGGPPACRRREEAAQLDRRLGLVDLDPGGEERHLDASARQVRARRGQPVEPAGVVVAARDLGAVEQAEQERLIGRPAADDDGRVGDGAPQARERLVASPAVRDDLRDHRVELRRDGVAHVHAAVDANPGAAGQPQQLDQPGRRRECPLRVLRVQPDLDRMAPDFRRLAALEPAPTGHVELQLHQIHARWCTR